MSNSLELQKIYKTRFSDVRKYRDKVWQILCSEFFSLYISPKSTVLDLGCGYGEFINNIHVEIKIGMDLNPDAKKHLQPSIEFLLQDCSEPWKLPAGCLDVVFTSNFFEHLPSKTELGKTLDEAWKALKPNGKLIAMGPNINAIPDKYWDFWDHYIPLSDLSLCEGLSNRGFRIEESVARFLPYTMVRQREIPQCLVKLYLKSRIIWPVFGKQFLIVAVKDSNA